MSKRTRIFFIVSALILVTGLGTGLVAYYGGGLPLFAQRSGPEGLGYIPADASVVAFANVRDVMSSEFRQKLRQVIPDGTARDEFQKETGIDIERDIDSVTVAVSASTKDGLFIIRGVFNQGQLEAAAQQHNVTAQDYHGKRVLMLSDAGSSAAAGHAIAFLEPGVVAIGSVASVDAAIDSKASSTVAANPDMMKLIDDVRQKGGTAWAVGRLDALTQTADLPGPIQSQLPKVRWFAVSGRVDGGISGSVRLEASDENAANDLRDVVRGGLALARLQMGRDTKLDNVINSLQLSGTGTTVELAFAVPPEVLDIINGAAGLVNLAKPGRQIVK